MRAAFWFLGFCYVTHEILKSLALFSGRTLWRYFLEIPLPVYAGLASVFVVGLVYMVGLDLRKKLKRKYCF